jgi:Uma2 family endonuclease
VGRILGNFAEEHDLGHVLNNDSGIITERDPDSMRGPDVAFYSYKLIPKGPVPDDYGPEIPELVVEVRWKNDRWPNVLAKVSEYLQAGVLAVLILDDDADKAILCLPDQAPQTLSLDDELRLPNILPDFAVTIRKFFE